VTYFFYVSGLFVTLIGTAWCVLILGQPNGVAGTALLGKAIALVPGLGVIGSGLVFLAIGGVLSRLDKIVISSADTADAMDILVSKVRKS
jgi:vacuolar-type H+-ATPase subunit I/STV1